jgi:hypothetical protein
MSDTAASDATPPKAGFKGSVLQVFTGADNQTLDLGRILWFKMSLAYIGLTAFHIIAHHAAFDPVAFGSGAAAVLAGGGAGVAIKANTEPPRR